MTIEQLILKLNWFYSLELNQVDLYHSQSKSFKNTYSGVIFERISYIEQQHVDNISEHIKALGGNPTRLGDVVSPILGSIAGTVLSISGLEEVLKINILIEQKAMSDYRELIKTLTPVSRKDYKELIKVLQFNLLDEDLHTAWFERKLSRLASQ